MAFNLFDLTGKTAVVTGGGGVLGGAVAVHLGTAGVKVAVLGRTGATLSKTREAVEAGGGEALALEADVLDEKQLTSAREDVLSAWGRIDILLNAAGGNLPGATLSTDGSFWDLSMDDFDAVVALNLQGTVLPTRIFGEAMAAEGRGCIINVSSMTVPRAVTRVAGYSAGKAAAENFTRWLAVETARKYGGGIRVNAIAPGFFLTEQNRRLLIREDGSHTERAGTIIRNTPMGRLGEPEEILSTVHWLCSDASGFVTGVVVPVDGGFSAFSGV